MLNLFRALVAAGIIAAAIPAAAQEAPPVPVPERREIRTVSYGGYGGYGLYAGYLGAYPRFHYPRRGFLYPVFRPQTLWVADEYLEQGRPLGMDPNAYGDKAYSTPGYSGWPYYDAGRDEAPSKPPTPKAQGEDSLREGRALWKAADYAGALASFKKAVAADLADADARLHMALGLLAAGDLKNADKALASALDLAGAAGDIAGLGLDRSFKNPKEQQKFESRLAPG